MLCLVIAPLQAQETNIPAGPKVSWTKGPATASVGNLAEIKLPENYIFTGAKGSQTLLKAWGNPISGAELGLLAPTSMVWVVVFEFDKSGYVKDNDKDKLDADAMLKSLKAGTVENNKERKKMGSAPMNLIGWEQPPKYNPETHNLEWAMRYESEGSPIINYNTRLLGRKGVMEVSLIVDPDKLAGTMADYQGLLANFDYKAGERYAEYRQGDQIAKYGLAALITGGAAVVAVKSGLLGYLLLFGKKLWFLIVAGVAAVARFFKRLVNGEGRKPSAD